ncbi:hypothetical protein FSP39_025434 [Pinctada imbricata]|uniref:DUF3421 domain-containing protein n=1 Tax=Pinctada imbricata TaxID=66713 RepID=A0AA88Y9Q5_PINIB|nr:hypothetical protein FSP39_025434 [Pinctada imbricata]
MVGWQSTNGSNIPDHAVRGGYDSDRRPLFVARASHNGEWVPGKAAYHLPGCHIPWGGEEIIKQDYEVLVFHARENGFLDWQKCHGGECPSKAFFCHPGVYPARAYYEGGLHPGKCYPPHGCAYISYGGKEISLKDYEVLYQAK